MQVGITRIGDVSVVAVSGDVTLGHGHLSRPVDMKGQRLTDAGEALRRLVDDGRTRIVLDLKEARFIDSAGLGTLVALKRRAVEHGGDVKLARATGRVRETLELVRLTELFDVHDSVEAAAASF